MQPHKILALGYRAAIPMLGPQVVSFAAKWLYLATTSRYSSSVQRSCGNGISTGSKDVVQSGFRHTGDKRRSNLARRRNEAAPVVSL